MDSFVILVSAKVMNLLVDAMGGESTLHSTLQLINRSTLTQYLKRVDIIIISNAVHCIVLSAIITDSHLFL